MDPLDRQRLLDDLAHEDEEIRRLAVERLSLLPALEAVPCLVERLGDPSWRVRKSAVERLTAQDDASPAVRALVAALADGQNSGRRNAALEALTRFGNAAVPALLEASHAPDVDVRKQVVDALGAIGILTRTWSGTTRNSSAHLNFREANYGSKWYWDTTTNPSAPYRDWTPPAGGGTRIEAFEGDEFYLRFRLKLNTARVNQDAR